LLIGFSAHESCQYVEHAGGMDDIASTSNTVALP
jgi:hypothetical protein